MLFFKNFTAVCNNIQVSCIRKIDVCGITEYKNYNALCSDFFFFLPDDNNPKLCAISCMF